MTGRGEPLFVYGTLRFPQVLRALLGRVPENSAAAAAGWRAAALAGHVYPGLVPAPGATVEGLLLTGLSAGERDVLDAFEGPEYEPRPVELADGRRASAYVWRGGGVLDAGWDAAAFARRELAAYAAALGRTG
ncbi:gamma-glutamylcyclotransferase [Streptomyces armeniacus]|uniref:Putative gamma-glutamylcyclotransferase n=1 Tax=Streptomyces armeniacus TaxID=83291 RepID=A0A345XLR6_9ACTN|nr:gamma-glutamylcyclotransferase family protein [Streptomyces armeniacus]AXK32582.1 gamma-glutamylcyclotransferase [Streptomyces armeniacus]